MVEELATTVDEALDLLREFSRGQPAALEHEQPGPLLEQCLALCAEYKAAPLEPVRTIHHLACTGGTLISKCLAAMPNTQVLSEVDPLSTLQDKPAGPSFAPTDMIRLARQSTRGASPELLAELFLNNLALVHAEAARNGQRLLLRDHAHSHFCSGPDIPQRPTLRAIVASRVPVASVVTVRHPIDSYLALQANKFLHFQPQTFDEYCRRSIAFLDAYEGLPVVKYEDFVERPQETIEHMCQLLGLAYVDHFIDVFGVFRLTGDSGRRSDVIESRPRRPLEAALLDDVATSLHYRLLQERLGYR